MVEGKSGIAAGTRSRVKIGVQAQDTKKFSNSMEMMLNGMLVRLQDVKKGRRRQCDGYQGFLPPATS